MNKRILAIVGLLALSATSVSAAAVGGEFAGFPTANLIINDKAIQSDVPAMNVNGTTMVPIRVVSEQFGGTVTWNQDTQTVLIQTQPDSKERVADKQTKEENPPEYEPTLKLLHTLKQTVQENVDLIQQLNMIYQIQAVDYQNQMTINDFEVINEVRFPEILNEMKDMRQETADLIKEYPNSTLINYSALLDEIKNYVTQMESFEVGLDEFNHYLDGQDVRDLRNYLVYSYTHYKKSNQFAAFVDDQLLELEVDS